MTKVSAIRDVERHYLQELISASDSLGSVLRKLGISTSASFYLNELSSRIIRDDLDISSFKAPSNNRLKISDVFVENSKTTRTSIRRIVLANNLIEYKCSECPVVDTYNGKPVSLQLDHINGIRNDHRLENLRWLCPTCHSQTTTYAGKSLKIQKTVKKCDCGNILNWQNTSGYCRKCASNKRLNFRKFEVSKDELTCLIENHSMLEIGRMFGVSDNAVRKRCKSLGVSTITKNSRKLIRLKAQIGS